MGTIKIDTEEFRIIAAFEHITKVHPKDCLVSDGLIYFLVDSEKLGLAIGKNGATIKDVSKKLGKPVKLFEYSKEPQVLVKNMIPTAENIEVNGEEVRISVPMKDRSAAIGRGGKNINIIKEFLDRHCGIKSLRIK